tara:strand:+ start:393 stop:569 length:177 start_codon:yes stop_codon:yes gene_type:complete
MDLTDKLILEANPEELSDLQQIDINTQLDGVWFYGIYQLGEKILKKHNIAMNNLFEKK